MQVLALDSSEQQLDGSERRATTPQSSSTITTRAFWLGEGPSFDSHPGSSQGAPHTSRKSLEIEDVVDEWLQSTRVIGADGRDSSKPVPVVFVALHACGSLTPDILKKIVQVRYSSERLWYVSCAVVVGCCYNLMRKSGKHSFAALLMRGNSE